MLMFLCVCDFERIWWVEIIRYNYSLNIFLDGSGSIPSSTSFSLLHSVQTSSGAHPASYAMSTVGSLPRVKWEGPEADHTLPSRAEARNGEAIPPLPNMSSWHNA
jgi:hypothetical protein